MEITVTNWAEYDKYIDLLRRNYELYERKFKNNAFTLLLANGDYIYLSFDRDKIPHLLGVDVDKYRSSGIVRTNTPADEIIEKLVNGDISYSSYKGNNKKNITEQFFSKNFMEKQKAFEYITTIDTRETYCIVKYDREKIYQSEPLAEPCDYYIIRKVKDEYYVLGLIKNEKTVSKYEPVTSRMYDSEEEFEKFFSKISKKQELTYSYKLKIDNYNYNYHQQFLLYTPEKQITLKRIMDLASKYDSVASVAKDLSFTLQGSQNKYQNNSNNMAVISALTDALKKGAFFTEDDMNELLGEGELKDDIIKGLVDVCNDRLVNQSTEFSEENSRCYSEMQKENNSLKATLSSVKEELESMKKELEMYKERQEKLLEEKDVAEKKIGIFKEAIDKFNSI